MTNDGSTRFNTTLNQLSMCCATTKCDINENTKIKSNITSTTSSRIITENVILKPLKHCVVVCYCSHIFPTNLFSGESTGSVLIIPRLLSSIDCYFETR